MLERARSLPEINKTVRAKRRNSTQAAIRAKAERGEATGKERALVRIGASNTRVLTGQDDLSDWSDEELRYGRRASKDGTFDGRPPKIVPKALHDELIRRTLSQANDLMRTNLPKAVEMLVHLATSGAVEPKDRLRAINMIMERVMGKPADKVEISGDAPWLIALQAGIVRADSADHVVDEDEDDVEDAEWREE